MRQQLRVSTDANGMPCVAVPLSCMWELVEHLNYQRTAVSYHYESTHFTVVFLRQEAEGAQRILDEWTSSSSQCLQSA